MYGIFTYVSLKFIGRYRYIFHTWSMIWVWDEILPSYIGGITVYENHYFHYIRIPTKQPVFLSLAHVILPQNG